MVTGHRDVFCVSAQLPSPSGSVSVSSAAPLSLSLSLWRSDAVFIHLGAGPKKKHTGELVKKMQTSRGVTCSGERGLAGSPLTVNKIVQEIPEK